MSKKEVGLFVFTTIDGFIYAVCQRRGLFDFDYLEGQLFAGVLLPTCSGGVSESGDYLDALWSMAENQLGDSGFLPDDDELVLVVDQEGVKTYAVMVELSVVGGMQLHSSTGGFHLISLQEVDSIRCTKPEDKGGVPPGEIVMFPDDLEGLRAAFRHFTSKQ